MPRLLCVGRLIPIKGHIVLLRAFAEAKQELPDLELEIAGRGPLEPALKALVRELGIARRIRFLGHVSPIQAAIERAAVVVVPSMGEGFGMVALEAMERSRPVIAAPSAASASSSATARPGSSSRPARRRRSATRSCVSPATSSSRAEMGEAGRRRALSRFLQTFCTERTELLYQGALERAA